MASTNLIVRELAALLLSKPWSHSVLVRAAERYLRSRGKAVRKLVDDVTGDVPHGYPPSPERLAAALKASSAFERASAILRRQQTAPALILAPPLFSPAPGFSSMGAPQYATPGEVAAWLGLPLVELDWLADTRRLQSRTHFPILHHYVYTFARKRSGALRLIEAPKPKLKAVQRRILTEILNHTPVHPSAHGFVRGRSCITGAQVHAGEHVVACLDLKDFFPGISAARIYGLFRSIGYPHAAARLLTGLCTTMTPAFVFDRLPETDRPDWQTRKRFGVPHLAQGAPTSPALANLLAWRLDQRCVGLAASLGGRYTRYADDLTFSGDEAFAHRLPACLAAVAEIARDEGFALNAGKTRIMRRSRQQCVTGVVVNERVNLARADYDALKALLHNCRTKGPGEQNRKGHPDFRAHLAGRVTWAEQLSPQRGARLRQSFEAITW